MAFQRLYPQSESLRPWPYPFEAGLSIANDAEFMSFEFYDVLLRYLNTDEQTPLGKGIRLPFSTSVFFYSVPEYNFSYFDGAEVDGPTTQRANAILDGIRSGWIDTLHAYGDFDGVGGFTRDHAQRIQSELESNGLNVPVFTNHGGVENRQNVGKDAAYHQGDVVGSSAYHTDLFESLGVRYVWTDSLVTAMQPKQAERGGLFSRFWRKPSSAKAMEVSQTRLFQSNVLQDGSPQKGFLRFRSTGVNAPNLSSFKYQLEQLDWAGMYQQNGACVIYQHLGVLHRINGQCTAASIKDLQERPEALLSPFHFLKSEMQQGKLWVARLADFLNYCEVLESLLCKSDTQGTIHLSSTENWSVKQLAGVTLYVDVRGPISVIYGGQPLAYVANGPDGTGRYSVTLTGEEA